MSLQRTANSLIQNYYLLDGLSFQYQLLFFMYYLLALYCSLINYYIYLSDGLPDDCQLMLLLLNFHLVRVVLSVSGKHYWACWHVLDTNQYQHVFVGAQLINWY